MRKLFYIGLAGLAIFEVLNVYFIMPFPGSQRFDTVQLAYFLYTWRWVFRAVFAIMTIAGVFSAFRVKRIWVPVAALILAAAIAYFFNFRMTADRIFRQPERVVFSTRGEKTLGDSSVVVAVSAGAEARAYPVRYIVYHHQVKDTLAGKPIIVTYCSVCRSGRVFEPVVNGKPERFRLVGMDHFNAMFEDETTGSWWRQATGEAIAGPLKGAMLPEIASGQVTLGKFFSMFPFGKVMEADETFWHRYDTLGRFEQGRSKSSLTRTDSLSWKDKSWVVGVVAGGRARAYDWNDLRRLRVVNDTIGSVPVVIALSDDSQSFACFLRDKREVFVLRNDSLISGETKYDFAGRGADGNSLTPVHAYQEFWHSWKTFHPTTTIFSPISEK